MGRGVRRPGGEAIGRSGGGRRRASYMSSVSPLHGTIGPLLFALASLRAGSARAQATPEGDTTATIRGAVYDSLLTGGPLPGAEVWLEGTNRSVRTDDRGRFEVTGIRPGRYTLTFYHSLLDSTRLAASPITVLAEAGRVASVLLTTPSPTSVHSALCPHDPLANTGVVLALTVDGTRGGGVTVAGARVTAEWTELRFEPGLARWEPRVATARSDSSGRAVLCNVPTDVTVLLRGQLADGPSAMRAVELNGRPFGRADLLLVRGGVTGTVIGVVRTGRGGAAAGALVSAVGTETRTEADDEGRFLLREVAGGSRIVEARAVGFRPAQVQVIVAPGEARRVEITLGDTVQVLAPISVAGSAYLSTVGFERRRKSLQGHFLDESDIARTGATRVEEVFRLVPGVQLRPSGMGYIIEFQRGQGQITNPALGNYCPPSYYIDGNYFPLPPNQTLTLPLVPGEILAIEVYSNLFSAPQQYQRRDSGCGIILIWTKRGVPNPPK